MNPAKADRPLRGAGVLLLAQGRADFGQINDEGRALPCTERREVSIFDSLVAGFFGEIR